MEANYVDKSERGVPRNTRFLLRLKHFTWAWFTLPMSTGGLALLLASQPHTFHGLETIGKIVYIFDLCICLLTCTAITYRFLKYPGTFHGSLNHPTEGLFFSTILLCFATIVGCMAKYGASSSGPWLVAAYRVLFWVYWACTLLSAVFQYHFLFTSPRLKIQDATPAWDLPIFPFMLTGTIASIGIPLQPKQYAMSMLVGGLTAQGLGMMVSVLMFSIYLRRMIQFGLPNPNTRPAMFLSVGPASFTCVALIGLANSYPTNHASFGDPVMTRQILRVVATFVAIFIWSLSLWFFGLSLIAVLATRRQMRFHLNWWAFVFPNVGFTIATIDIGKQLSSPGTMWVGSGMTVVLVVIYFFVLYHHVRAVLRREILFEGQDEDAHTGEGDQKKRDEESARRSHDSARLD